MIDYIKIEIHGLNPQTLLANPLLDFFNRVNEKTGEMGSYLNAYTKGLEFKMYDPTEANPKGRITLEGSLHKYWNGGAHNFNDFGLVEVWQVLDELNRLYGIDPVNSVLRVLEIGVNILPPVPTKMILHYCLFHKTDCLKWIYTRDEGEYKQGRHQRHTLKLYNKRKHYEKKGFTIDREILRIEKKWEKMQELNKRGIYTLSDLLNYGLNSFATDLLKEWENVLFYDWQTLNGTKCEASYSNPNFWEKLKRENFKYHRRRLNELIQQNPNNLKNKVGELIREKAAELNSNPTQINPLYIRLIQVVPTLEDQAKERRVCVLTGLNISMQEGGSFHLSHTGLNYYWQTDKKVFDEVRKKYLSDRWKDADKEIQIRELAHNIRNHHNNKRIKEKRIYPPAQTNLLTCFLNQ